jgi:hypothetical protein
MNVLYRLIIALALIAASSVATAQNTSDGGGPTGPSCSPTPCVLPPVQVSPGPNSVDSAPIATDPSDPSNIIVGSNDRNCGFQDEPSLGFFSSRRGGSAWNQYWMPARSFEGQVYLAGEEPILGYDLNGTAYVAGWYADNGSGSNVTFEGFEESADGAHWSAPAPAVYRNGYFPNCSWLAVDTNISSPYVNSVYISCVMSGTNENQMIVAHSSDGGATWHQVDAAGPEKYPAEDLYQSIAVGKGGTVYLTWLYCEQEDSCGNGPAYVMFSRSSDGGNTWSSPTLVDPVTLIYPLPNTHVNAIDTPVIGVDASTGAYAGTLYVASYNWTGTFMQVVVVRSTDGGGTWSKPVPVAPGITHDQFFPWLSISPSGLVGVSWLDRRNDPANVNYQAFAAISADGGLSFNPNVELTQNFSDPNVFGIGNASYDGAAWNGPDYFLAAWMDTSNGLNTQDVLGGIRLK